MIRTIATNATRRSVATLAAVLATLVLLAMPAAAEQTTEQAAIDVVNAFIAGWSTPGAGATRLAPNASVRLIEDQPAIVGPDAFKAAFQSFMTPGVSIEVDTRETTAYGGIVVNRRVDTVKTAGKPDQVYPVVGVFVVRDGKIVEWVDYHDK